MATQEQAPNAVEMLKQDHAKVMRLFQDHQAASAGDRAGIATQIFNELDIHATLEEEIFYPAVREEAETEDIGEEDSVDEDDDEDVDDDEEVLEDTDDSDDIIAISYEEHAAVKEMVKRLRKMEPNSGDYEELFEELQEAVQDHISEEEEVVIPAAQLKLDLETIGRQMQQRRIALVSSMAA